jgi:hypothetical protein
MQTKSCCIVVPCGCLVPLMIIVVTSVGAWAISLF